MRTCRIDPGGLSLAERWISERRSLWERRLDRLAICSPRGNSQRPLAKKAKKR